MDKVMDACILILLGISTLIQVCDMCGFLPGWIRKKFRINKSQDTLEVLKEFGIDANKYKRKNAIVGIPRDYDYKNIENCIETKLKELIIDKEVSVGMVRKTELNYYIDLIGHTCNEECAQAYARILTSYWAETVEKTQAVKTPIIDFIVTPKGGSPILGYEFSKLMQMPFVLHEERARFDSEKDDMRKWFDCSEIPPKGARALIVDDSTTGGRMVLSVINDLRKYGYEVSECLVVFEPQNKDARKKLSDQEVNLISIVKTHKE